MDYTEPVYKNKNTDELCRISDSILVYIDGGVTEGVLTVNSNGEKIAYMKSEFNNEFDIYNLGETPAYLIIKEKDNGND